MPNLRGGLSLGPSLIRRFAILLSLPLLPMGKMLDLYLVMEYGIQLFMLNVTSEYCVFLVRLM